jgi:hypothetical protein
MQVTPFCLEAYEISMPLEERFLETIYSLHTKVSNLDYKEVLHNGHGAISDRICEKKKLDKKRYI